MIRLSAAVAAVAVLAAGAGTTHAAPGPDASVGVSGEWQAGAWTPLEIRWPDEASAAGNTIRVAVQDPDGQFVASPPLPLQEVAGGGVRAVASVRFGRPDGRVRIVSDPGSRPGGGVVRGDARAGIPSTSRVALVFGDLPQAVRAMRLVDRERGSTTQVVAAADAGVREATSFDMADVIVLCGAAVPALSEAVVRGIDERVRSGGRLVLLAGASAAGIASRVPAASWLPGVYERMVPLRRVGAIETFARVTGLAELLPSEGLAAPRFAGPIAGSVDAAASEGSFTLPLAVRRAHGFGTVTWIGVDVDREPFREWAGTEALLFTALEGRRGESTDVRDSSDRAVVDLAAQLRGALESFSARDREARPRVIPFEVVAGVGLLYVLALYPFDWWVASRSAARPWLAWLTLPGLAIAFTAVAAWLASGRVGTATGSGTAAEVVDIDVESAAARGSSWVAVLSGDNDRLDVAADVAPAIVAAGPTTVSWFADAGRGFGGIDAAVAHPSLAAADYGYGDSLAELRGVPVAAGATRLFEARWSGTVDRGLVESTLRGTSQGTLAGSIVHRLPFTLERCRLLHAGWLYELGTLRPGEAHDCSAGRGPRSLASALTRRRAGADRDAAVGWDASGRDVARILELAGFYAAAGGRDYAGLPAGRLSRLDLSPLLTVDRAVLIGEPVPAAPTASWTVTAVTAGAIPLDPASPPLFRIVLPVTAEAVP
ncbi:MAG: hypothetical protein ACKO4Z_12910 [Planctomycetota bacterium]